MKNKNTSVSVRFKTVSGLVKARLNDSFEKFPEYSSASALLGDRLYFSAIYKAVRGDVRSAEKAFLHIESALSEYIKVSSVEQVAVRLPHYKNCFDDDYICHKPGLYPDLLTPLYGGCVYIMKGELRQLYFELNVPETLPGGDYPVRLSLTDSRGNTLASAVISIKVIPVCLPSQETAVTQWFYCDCLADYYGVGVFSEEHWRIIENFAVTARHNGINTLLAPVFTPPLDTAVGGERPTVQLVDITRENGVYSYNWDKLRRFVDMWRRVGMEYLEIPHFFTQWGAEHSPKIVAKADGEEKRIFGWDTELDDGDFRFFLRDFIKNLLFELRSLGVDKHCIFHISDEPKPSQLESYKKAKAIVFDLIKDYPVRDALSSYALYESGAVTLPIPSVSTVDEFIEKGVPGLWTYYCCGEGKDTTNRFVAMPAYRTRMIGIQMYKFNIKGFLHWGYNFWNSRFSTYTLNPYRTNDGDFFSPAGDAFAVYPAGDGTALETLHLTSFTQALYDIRALKLAESVAGKDRIISLIDEAGEVTFRSYPKNPEFLTVLREKINAIIETGISSQS